jgi:peroxiredoxin
MLAVGTVAPDFTLPDQKGVIIRAESQVKAADNPEQMLRVISE